ncbi:MAG: rhomboid family intramembrane serine protease [Microbacteriaceae bacterium]
MRAQRQSAPRTKSRVFSSLRSGAKPVMTYGIIAVTAFVFIVQSLPGIGGSVTGALQYAGVYSVPGAGVGYGFEPWRMLTSVFVHASILHIALNMYTLWIFGMIMEPMLGRGRYLALYLISGFAGSLGVYVLAPLNQPVVGASGAIFGLVGAFFVIQRHLGGSSTQLLILVGINLVIGFIPSLGIAWQAHVGGLIGGILVGLIYVWTRPMRRRAWQIPALAVLSLLLVAGIFLK